MNCPDGDATDNDNPTEADEDHAFFTRQCLELANLLRTEQTEDFLHLYDSLPAEWSGARLETAKESIRQLQELDEHDFAQLYQGDRTNMSHHHPLSEQSMLSGTSRITSSSTLKREQYYERTVANDQAYDEIHDARPSSSKRFPTTHKSRTSTAVDSFVQLNLTPTIDIKLADYKKTIAASQHRVDSQAKMKSHEEAVFNYYPTHDGDEEEEDDDEEKPRSRSSSSTTCSTSDSSSSPTDASHSGNLIRTSFPAEECTPAFEHGKLIPNRGFDSHGSSTATKSSSDNSGSARTGSGSDSDDEHHRTLSSYITSTKSPATNKLISYDNTPTMVLHQTSENRSSLYDGRISSLPEQNSFQLVQPTTTTTEEHSLLAIQVPRFKLPSITDPNGTHELHGSSTTPGSLSTYPPATSQANRPPEQAESQNSNPGRKPGARASKKRKQSQQQEIIRTELIPGHRGDLDVDELVMFIDGTKSSSAPLRPTDTNSNGTALRRKARKPNKPISQIDENRPSSVPQAPPSPPPPPPVAESPLANGASSFSPVSDPPSQVNPSNSETISEPFVTVVHRRRGTKERRQETNQSRSSRYPPSSVNEKRRPPPVVPSSNKAQTPPSLPAPPPPSSVPTAGSDPLSPRLSSHSSSSSLSSLLKRPSKAPPVVFLNKSADVELNGVSFGFDLDQPSSIEESKESHSPEATSVDPPPYVDPQLLFQYNQQRYAANYSQQLAYMNMMRAQYLTQQPQYVLLPSSYNHPDEKSAGNENQPGEEESFVVYATIPTSTGQIYFHPISTTTKNYSSAFYYPNGEHLIPPSSTAYFQPIPSLPNEHRSPLDQSDDAEEAEEEEDQYERSTRLFHQSRQQASSHIMSNALQLVYSQEKRQTPKDAFNLHQVTAYLAMRWTDTIDRYDQGDDEILFVTEQSS